MKSVFIITEQQNETRGHGNFGKITVLKTYDGYKEKKFPAFISKEEAKKFIDEIGGFLSYEITEIEIWDKNII